MKRYFKNLLTALLGRDPYRIELDELKEKLEKASENVESLNEQLYAALNWWDNSKLELGNANKQLAENARQIASLQALTENLRERIREKDALMEQMREEYERKLRQQAAREKNGGAASCADVQE